jgi:hypothetical protein
MTVAHKLKRMSIREFRETGCLQEINRLLLHPRGLALEVIVDRATGEECIGVWDYRHDIEGMWFEPPPEIEKAVAFAGLLGIRRYRARCAIGLDAQETVIAVQALPEAYRGQP